MSIAATAALFAVMGAATLPLYAADSKDSLERNENGAQELAAAVERFNARDPQSPQTLNARLDYAAFLARDQTGACRTRLDGALSQLDLVTANPALEAVLPSGQARAADVEYQIHSARAKCGNSEMHAAELRAALDSAGRAVDLYRDAFDAVSMVTMQFNRGVAFHDLGDTSAAVTALQKAIAMDREYGYADDAEDNYTLLLQWTGEQSTPDQVAERMQDFPERSVTLAFGWSPGTAEVNLDSDYTQVANGQVMKIHSERSAQRRVRKGLGSWKVSFQAASAQFELANLPMEDPALQGFGTSIAGNLLRFHDYKLADDGDFYHGNGTFKFAGRLRADTKELARTLASRDMPTAQLMQRVSKALHALQASDVLESLLAEDYNFDTGTWIGATLEQGVWYTMTASLSLLLDPQVFVQHDIEFAYTRPVPCVADARDSACVEIVLHATADPAILKVMLSGLANHLLLGQSPQLQAVTEMRLIVDPITLVAYRRDMRRYSYWSDGTPWPNHALAESEKTSILSRSLNRTDGR